MNLLTMFFTLSAVTDNVFFTLFTASFALSIKLLSDSLLFLLSLSSSFDTSDSSAKSFASSIVASIDS